MHGSVGVRRSSAPLPPGGSPEAPGTPTTHHFPPMAVDSLHHHHANNHNSHQHMARIKAGVARGSSSSASSSSVSSGSAARVLLEHRASLNSSASSSGAGSPRVVLDHRSSPTASSSSSGTGSAAGAGSNERLTPRRFLEKYSLPRVVRVVAEPGADRRPGGAPSGPLAGPLAEPLLLYRQYSSCKVAARSLRRDGKQVGAEVGPPLVIPDSYQGWFSLVRERSLQTRAKVFTSVQQLVTARVAVFLAKNPLSGFRLVPSSDGETSAGSGPGPAAGSGSTAGPGGRLQYARTSVRGGQVLRLLAVFEDNESGRASTRSNSSSSSSWRSRGALSRGAASRGAVQRFALLGGRTGGAQPQQYAQCLTTRNESLFVPVTTAGTFYAVSTEDPGDADLSRVYQLPQLLRLTADPLPVKVQLVCGPVQNPLPTGFSGLLVLEDVQHEDVVLACTLPRTWALPSSSPSQPGPSIAIASSDKPVFLEMDADSKFLLTRPLASREAEARFFKTPLLRRVLAYCRERADLWSSQMKVTHHVFPAGDTSVAAAPAPTSLITPAPSEPQQQQQRAAKHASEKTDKREERGSSVSGKAASLSSGGTKKSQSFRYASPAMMVSTASSSASSGSGGTKLAAPAASRGAARGTTRGTHQLLQQLQSLPAALHGLKNILQRGSTTAPPADDVPLSAVFPELFGQPPAPGGDAPAAPAPRHHLRFYADDLPYGRVADAIVPDSSRDFSRHHEPRSLYDDEDDDEENDDNEEENIYAEICECPRGVVVSGARVILTTASSEERRGYFTFASATSKDQYCYLHTGGSDGTLSGTMSSSNPSNPEEDIYDTVC